jgi:hypothetical protein
MQQSAARRYRVVMAEDLHIREDGKVVLRRDARMDELEVAWDGMNKAERDEANAYVTQLAVGEITLEQFVLATFS